MSDIFSNSDSFDYNKNENLFPPLSHETTLTGDSFNALEIPAGDTDKAGSDGLLWKDASMLSIPDNTTTAAASSSSSLNPATDLKATLTRPAPSESPLPESSAVFNISWGGNDKPPAELRLDQQYGAETMISRKPLPKPRGIRRLPEPEPAEDGTLDEDTLRRRRNTDAARRSRLKKFLKIEYLENRVNALQAENAKLVLNNALLESEKRSWLAKEAEYKKRIKYLEESTKAQKASPEPEQHRETSSSPGSTEGWIVGN